MAAPKELSSLEALIEREADDPDDSLILERIKKLASTYLPDGWLQWKVIPHTREDLLGSHLDPLVLNKIRFALPTVELARAFCPECTSLSEKTYKDMKIKMLGWPFCIGLIIGPPSIGSRIRGSAVQNELIVASLAELKPLLLSRKEASRELADNEDVDDSSLRSSSSKSKKLTRIDKLEQNFSEMKEMLSSIMGRLSNNVGDESEIEAAYPSSSDDDLQEEYNPSQNEKTLESSDWKAPALTPEDDDEDFGFSPQTKEQEPPISTPKAHIEEQGIRCLRLGELAYKQIRYAEVQKKLQAFPVFHASKVNPFLIKLNPANASSDSLAKQESSFGAILHGLLLQREALTSAIKELSSKHNSLKSDIKEALAGPNSAFKAISDDILQYVCGRKVEIIELRRNAILPKDEYYATLLNAIPPSSTHLFDEQQVSELMKQPSLQGFFRGYSSNPYKPRPQPRTSTNFEQRKKFPKTSKSSYRPRPHTVKATNAESGKSYPRKATKRSQIPGSRDRFHRETDAKKPKRS